eukprot:1181614-Prorocentrum_minimum.AAC.3
MLNKEKKVSPGARRGSRPGARRAGESVPREYSLSTRAVGLYPGNILSRRARLACTPGMFSLDARGWLVPRGCSLSTRAVGSRSGYVLSRPRARTGVLAEV